MEAKELEDLQQRLGGKYKLVTLYQKRLRELQRGLPKLAESESPDPWDTVYQEIMAGKVDLAMGEEAEAIRKEIALREAEEAEDKKPKQLEAAPEAPAKSE